MYIGRQIETSAFARDIFSGNASTTDFTLSTSPAGEVGLAVYIAGVHQTPFIDYTVSGVTISFSSAPASGTNNICVIHLGKPVPVGSVEASGMPSGSVVQVIGTSKNDAYSLLSSTFTTVTGLSLNITPTSSTNKILILANVPISNSTTQLSNIRIARDGSAISNASGTMGGFHQVYTPTTNEMQYASLSYLDSPATTSQITYAIQVSANSGSTVYVNRNAGSANTAASTFTLLEIKA